MNEYIEELEKLIEQFPKGEVDKIEFIKAQRNFKNKFTLETFYQDRDLYIANKKVDDDVKFALELILWNYKGNTTFDKSQEKSDEIEKSNAIVAYKVLKKLSEKGYTDKSAQLFIDNLNGAVQAITSRIENDIKQQKYFAISKLLGNKEGLLPLEKTLQFYNENQDIPEDIDKENLQKI